jgi:hypothetical protein
MPRRPARKGSSPVAAPAGALAPGTVLAAPVLDGRWTAYQVVSVTDGMPAIVALDWLGQAPPTLSEAGAAGLLRLTHHNWKGDLQYFRVSPGLPPSWRVVGVLPPPELEPCRSTADWPSGFAQVVAERRWATQISPEARAAYKAASSALVHVALGAMSFDLPASTFRLELGSRDVPVSPDTAYTWEGLDALPRLTEVTVHGVAAGLVAHLRARPLIDKLRWTHLPGPALDLSGTHLDRLSIDLTAPLALTLPSSLRELLLTGDPGLLEISEERRGARLEIHVIGDRKAVGLVRGVGALRGLELSSTGVVDAGAIVDAYPELQELSLRDATRVEDVARLAALRRLRRISFYGCYRLDVAALPPASAWPELERVRISGHRLPDATTLQERFGGAPRFELSDGKTEEWLAANFDNPFRDWIDYDTRAGRAAAAAWAEARAALLPVEEPAPPMVPPPGSPRARPRRAKPHAKPRPSAEEVLRTFVEAFNEIEAWHGIDTVAREVVADAFTELARIAGVDAEVAARWLDAWREF